MTSRKLLNCSMLFEVIIVGLHVFQPPDNHAHKFQDAFLTSYLKNLRIEFPFIMSSQSLYFDASFWRFHNCCLRSSQIFASKKPVHSFLIQHFDVIWESCILPKFITVNSSCDCVDIKPKHLDENWKIQWIIWMFLYNRT